MTFGLLILTQNSFTKTLAPAIYIKLSDFKCFLIINFF